LKKLLLLGVALCAFTLFGTAAFADQALEAENGTLSGSASVVTDSKASGGKAAKLLANGDRVRLYYSGTITSLKFTLRADQCSGAPKAALYVDGTHLGGITVSNSSAYKSWMMNHSKLNGAHLIDVVMEQDYKTTQCDRNIYVDRIDVVGTSSGGTIVVCSDTKDNDGDGKIDYPNDLGCTDANDTDEADPSSGTETTVEVPAKDTSVGNGVTKLTLDDTKDYIVKLPSEKKVGGLQIYGGKSIKIVGGHITANPDHTTINSDKGPLALYVEKQTSGPVHVEGVLFDDSAGGQMDAIDMNTPNATVTLKNIRALISGRSDQVHADCYSGFWDVGQLNIDGFTCYSNYQGLFFAGYGPVNVKNVNVGYRTSPYVADDSDGLLFWTTRYGTEECKTQGVTISGPVHVSPLRPGTLPEKSVWPTNTYPSACRAAVSNSVATWPLVPNISGQVYLSAPSNGDFVPEGMAGIGYVGAV
jgi:predicted xylan-binding protein with Ca-dependent carbohydrate-binding module